MASRRQVILGQAQIGTADSAGPDTDANLAQPGLGERPVDEPKRIRGDRSRLVNDPNQQGSAHAHGQGLDRDLFLGAGAQVAQRNRARVELALARDDCVDKPLGGRVRELIA
jgi:hypothetical protein